MDAWRYEFYLLVLKISHFFSALTRERSFQHSKIKFLSLHAHVITSMCYIAKIHIDGHYRLQNITYCMFAIVLP
jgi:hypothetical protein